MRTDLAVLTPETLAELTNRGLVKRAARDLERDTPTLNEDSEGTVTASFPDGVGTTLPAGGLERGHCTCGAPGVCRHLIGLVLAYRHSVAAPLPTDAGPTPPAPTVNASPTPSGGVEQWSPGEFTDEQVAQHIGPRALAAARRAERAGYTARVRRPTPADPVPTVELPSATVRFLVPKDLGFTRTDAVAGVRDDVLALAVWAFRAADNQHPGRTDTQVQVGGSAAPAGGPGLDAAVALAEAVLLDGAVHVGAGATARAPEVRRMLEAERMRWPLLAVEDLVAQLDAYAERSARYRPEALADHLAELVARRRAVLAGGAGLRSRVLGTEESAETPLRRARLDGLGARVRAVGAERVVEVFLAHADSATVLVLRRAYETELGLSDRRVAGVRLGMLAGGVVVTESAARSASRTVRLGTRRLSRTEATVSRGSWQHLPRTLLADDVAALAAELDTLPPRPIRARVAAELVRVVPVAEVQEISYAPGAQRLDAVIADPTGGTAILSVTHAACAPGRLDSVAEALRGDLKFVAGTVRRGRGGISIDPTGLVVGTTVVVPDLAAAAPGAGPAHPPTSSTDPVALALDESIALLAETAHRGLRHLPVTMTDRLRATADRLQAAGLRRAADSVRTLAGHCGPDPADSAVQAWIDSYLRISVAADLR
ncbi:hypothetical protein [Actinoplanes sp. NPDC051859]|uniref:hypothetical protein n=1 Tax=Actinoplanes sp. NPDC051859 TaxID=3363909 RepID=UPI0037BE2069